MDHLKEAIANAFAVMVIGFVLVLLFGAPVINGFVDLMRSLGAN